MEHLSQMVLLNSSIGQFLQDPLVVENQWQEHSLEEIGKVIEEKLSAVEEAARNAYGKLFESYCLLLFQLENSGKSHWISMPLNDIAGMEEATVAYGVQLHGSPKPSGPIEIRKELSISLPEESSLKIDTSIFRNKTAVDCRNVAELLLEMVKTHPAQKGSLERLASLSLIQAVETECQALFQPAVENFWSKKDTSLLGIIEHSNKKFDLKPIYKEILERRAMTNPGWLLENRFPLNTILTSLKHILSTTSREKAQLSLVEFANLLLFFGHSTNLDGVTFENVLRLKGIDQNSTVEIYFRLIRLYKLRKKALQVVVPFEESATQLAIDDSTRILKLVAMGSYFVDQEWVATV